MKKLTILLAAALALAPAFTASAEEAAKPKRKLQLKTYYNQFEKAKAEAVKNEAPILVFATLDGDAKSDLIKRFLFNNKLFKSFAQENFTVLILKGQKSAKEKSLVEKKSFKCWNFLERHVMDEARKGTNDTPDMLSKYPTAFIVSPDGEKKLAHMPAYDPELGFGAWAMDVVAKLEQGGVTANVSPALKKAMENPQPDVKMPASKKKK